MKSALRWTLVPVASMASCSGTVAAADIVSRVASRVLAPDIGARVEAVMPADVRAGIVYALAAAAWVVAGARLAPRHRRAVAMALYAAGAVLAWIAIRGWQFSEGHPRAYQGSHVPLVMTLAGGLLAAAVVVVKHSRRAGNEE